MSSSVTQGSSPDSVEGLAAGRRAALEAAAVLPRIPLACLHCTGPDAEEFLQGQFSCDVRHATGERATFGAYCTPQGRVLASFLLLRTADGFRILLPAALAEATATRLRRFVLRSRVKLQTEDAQELLAVAGPAAPSLLQPEFPELPGATPGTAVTGGITLVRLAEHLHLLVGDPERMQALRERISQAAVVAGPSLWAWLIVRAGLPLLGPAGIDRFVPQMLGLDRLGAVDFAKGCYPGQEIVARARYLGEVKRHLHRGAAVGEVHEGDALHSGGRAAGQVIAAAPGADGRWEFLAVVEDAAAGETLRVRDEAGPEARLAPSAELR